MYHSESFAKHGWETAVVAYFGAWWILADTDLLDTPPIPSLISTPHVHPFPILNPPSPLLRLPWALRAPIRILYQVISVIFNCLVFIPVHNEVLLVQNPPSIPTLLLAQVLARVTGARLVIDWHNTGYSILAMRVGDRSPLVKAATWFERKFGQRAYAHLFVTKALRDFLSDEWGLQGKLIVLHDRPPAHFRPTGPMTAHELFHRLEPHLSPRLPSWLSHPSSHTILTHLSSSNLICPLPSRPALLVSSTSWTADEDFDPLLTALDNYQIALSSLPSRHLPRLVVLITGKGALRAAFEKQVQAREKGDFSQYDDKQHGSVNGKTVRWTDVCVRCVFLPARDYPTLLGCADLGVSMHSSSSGRDLPMKIVDMFGCGVPVLSRDFACVGELVKDGQNGRVFDTGEELGGLLVDILSGFPNSTKLNQLRTYFTQQSRPSSRRATPEVDASEEVWSTWEQNWDRVMLRSVLGDRGRRGLS
ncbi:hypothetical protein M231_04579 [Tremella mesenterica]|uniref:Chitobiosyldiphosphodolichol beta-mannosyltransferase n=1 Tax=Tremella mesenterica TaxID=5217 RepID=A0A4Q1BK37_TREME|nr:hypothetical protein M231_04579 [Tremella mesenterica]